MYKFSGKGFVDEDEALILKQINNSFKLLLEPWTTYNNHILKYVSHESENNEAVLVTKFVYNTKNFKNLRHFLDSGTCTESVYLKIVIQVFMTLEVISKLVKGFVHGDLLVTQIFLESDLRPKLVKLPINDGLEFNFSSEYNAVVGDFGHSSTKKYLSETKKYPIFQDIFRFFRSTYDSTKFRSTIKPYLNAIFDGHFTYLENHTDKYGYVRIFGETERIITSLNLHHYSDVLNKVRAFRQYVVKI